MIPLLEAKGFYVMAVQNPLTSLAEDVATTHRLLAKQTGPVILLGHSYAGFVITEAGNEPNVAGLVYVSSYGPAEGESHDDLVKRFPAPAGVPAIHLDGDGFLWIAREKFQEAFAHDVDAPQARIMAAVQKPIAKKCFGAPVGAPAWKSKPSFRPLDILAIELTLELAQALPDLRIPTGIIVAARTLGTRTEEIPLQTGDVIHGVNGKPITTLDGLRTALAAIKPGEPVALQIERHAQIFFISFDR